MKITLGRFQVKEKGFRWMRKEKEKEEETAKRQAGREDEGGGVGIHKQSKYFRRDFFLLTPCPFPPP